LSSCPKHKKYGFSSRRGALFVWLGSAIVRDEEIDTIQKWLIQLRPMMLAYTFSSRDAIQLESGPFRQKKQLFKK
jgi:hypothetical protein